MSSTRERWSGRLDRTPLRCLSHGFGVNGATRRGRACPVPARPAGAIENAAAFSWSRITAERIPAGDRAPFGRVRVAPTARSRLR